MSDDSLLGEAMTVLAAIEADNSRECFERQRQGYERSRDRLVQICDGLHGWERWRVYRAHNDRRFRKELPPYKTFLGAVSERADGVGAFVRIDAAGVLIGVGIPMPAKDQLPRLRDAIADDVSGRSFETAIEQARGRGVTVHGGRWAPLQRVPRGCAADSARSELLRWKGVEASTVLTRPEWPSFEVAIAAIEERIEASSELQHWLALHVGPSALTAEERFAPKRRSKGT